MVQSKKIFFYVFGFYRVSTSSPPPSTIKLSWNPFVRTTLIYSLISIWIHSISYIFFCIFLNIFFCLWYFQKALYPNNSHPVVMCRITQYHRNQWKHIFPLKLKIKRNNFQRNSNKVMMMRWLWSEIALGHNEKYLSFCLCFADDGFWIEAAVKSLDLHHFLFER